MSQPVRAVRQPGGLPAKRLAARLLLLVGAVNLAASALLPIPDCEKVPWADSALILAAGWILLLAAGCPCGGCGKRRVAAALEHVSVSVVAFVLLKTLAVQSFFIPSESMDPALLVGDMLLASKFHYGWRVPYTPATRVFPFTKPARGDVVIFAYPLDDRTHVIKRVIGLPGDTVELRDRQVVVNGAVTEEPWAHWDGPVVLPAEVRLKATFGPVTVPKGKYLVLGDNRNASYDGRYWGLLDEGRIEAKALLTYWSWDGSRQRPRWGRIGTGL